MARDRTSTGWGLGNFENVYPQYAILQTSEIVDHAHNDWVEWVAEGGIAVRCAAWRLGSAALGEMSRYEKKT